MLSGFIAEALVILVEPATVTLLPVTSKNSWALLLPLKFNNNAR